jgi:hypothetical protein
VDDSGANRHRRQRTVRSQSEGLHQAIERLVLQATIRSRRFVSCVAALVERSWPLGHAGNRLTYRGEKRMQDYCVPVVVRGQAPGQTASVTLYCLTYGAASDVAAEQAVQANLARLCQLVAPNLPLSEFEVQQAMAINVSEVTPGS